MFEVDHVSKTFPGVRALDDVDLDVRPGEIHALLGENGAGKSTLIKIITGVYRPDHGRLLLDGKHLRLHSPRDAGAAGIAAVHQERNLVPRFSVAENLMLQCTPVRYGFVDYRRIRADARRWLDRVGLAVDLDMPASELSVAQAQLVEIAKALSLQSRVLLLDEPTASISPEDVDGLFQVLRRLASEGVALLFVSHKLEEVLTLCDRVTVLRDGKAVASGRDATGLNKEQVVSLMVGRSGVLGELPPRRTRPGTVALRLDHVSTELGHEDITLEVRHGEILGMYGLVGAGRSELARCIVGLHRVTGGRLELAGRRVEITNVRDALQRHRIGYVTEDRREEGLFLTHPVTRNVAATLWNRLCYWLGLVSAGKEKDLTGSYVKRLDIKLSSLTQEVELLSGGNQQKVSLAKVLAAEPQILIIDEPTVGIDVRTKNLFHELIMELADQGLAILLVSSDLQEVIRLADNILIMSDMRIAGHMANTYNYDSMSRRIVGLIHQSDGSPLS
ncbi:MAG: sugar ABC transporter ATP-binding protein [Nocardioidaceae bacterium]